MHRLVLFVLLSFSFHSELNKCFVQESTYKKLLKRELNWFKDIPGFHLRKKYEEKKTSLA